METGHAARQVVKARLVVLRIGVAKTWWENAELQNLSPATKRVNSQKTVFWL